MSRLTIILVALVWVSVPWVGLLNFKFLNNYLAFGPNKGYPPLSGKVPLLNHEAVSF
jgi:hypothetical protein